jgi:hypothetical protein
MRSTGRFRRTSIAPPICPGYAPISTSRRSSAASSPSPSRRPPGPERWGTSRSRDRPAADPGHRQLRRPHRGPLLGPVPRLSGGGLRLSQGRPPPGGLPLHHAPGRAGGGRPDQDLTLLTCTTFQDTDSSPGSRSRSHQRSAHTSPARSPVVAHSLRNRPKVGSSRSEAARASRTSAGVGTGRFSSSRQPGPCQPGRVEADPAVAGGQAERAGKHRMDLPDPAGTERRGVVAVGGGAGRRSDQG